jgi:hypothetical protein
MDELIYLPMNGFLDRLESEMIRKERLQLAVAMGYVSSEYAELTNAFCSNAIGLCHYMALEPIISSKDPESVKLGVSLLRTKFNYESDI